ncbi:hypothetical protein [Rhodoplanes roseus]|uniref:Lipoprotein n=1 Tax=Rhodoplanes roseus TaxID=29409 RepID=A0A327KXF6_9BRAD|nr:hypothetical protein [Rhodoplanes roseus]RAI42981.1 hypothetical protein CH341_16745 [Rhodoplanes roseus]
MAGLLAAGMVGACSSTDEFFNGQPAPPEKSSSTGFADRFRSLFGSSAEAQAAVPAQAQPGGGSTLSSLDVDCPSVDIRQGASTLQMNAPGSDQAMGLRYQATFGRTARQCTVSAGTLAIKIGVQGRLILGPAGGPGETQIPLRYALVKEGIEPKTIWSKLYMLPVQVPPGQPNVPFTHVAEDMVVPVPPPADLDHYVIYVGFDPQGAVHEKKPVRKPRQG